MSRDIVPRSVIRSNRLISYNCLLLLPRLINRRTHRKYKTLDSNVIVSHEHNVYVHRVTELKALTSRYVI